MRASSAGRSTRANRAFGAPMSAASTCVMSHQRCQLPFARRAVVPQDEAPAVVNLHLEITVCGFEPAVEDFDHREAPFTEREATGFFFAPVPGVALDADV